MQQYLQSGFSALFNAILLQAKNFDAALRTMESLGLGYSRKELEALLSELERGAQAFHQHPLSPDWLMLYIDAKEVDLKDEHEQVKKAVHFIVVDVNPRVLPRSLRSTNLAEGINNVIETIRRSADGHFHIHRGELTIKMKIMIDQLSRCKWAKPHPMIAYHRATLIHI